MNKYQNNEDFFEPIFPSIDFNTIVDGHDLTASIVAIADNPVNDQFKIKFSDGHEDIFSQYYGKIYCNKREQSQKYPDAISADLIALNGINPSTIMWNFSYNSDNDTCNIWVFEKESDEGLIYSVYKKADYSCTISNNGKEFIAISASILPAEPLDAILVKKVIDQLEKEARTVSYKLGQ